MVGVVADPPGAYCGLPLLPALRVEATIARSGMFCREATDNCNHSGP